MTELPLGFVPTPLVIPFEKILPSRKSPAGLATSKKFRQIVASIREVGLIEPLCVTVPDAETGCHTLLDGHTRVVAMKELGMHECACLVATDDEAYTYNNRVNRLSSIQEHFMIKRALEQGVPSERLARALDVDVSLILKKARLLKGVCPEAAELLKDRTFAADLTNTLRRMKPTRQVECLELMVAANNLSSNYASALLVATPAHMLVEEKKPAHMGGVGPEQVARMEREMASLQDQYRLVEQSYGQDVLSLVLARGYVTKLLANTHITKYLQRRYADIFEQMQALAIATNIE